MSQVSYCPVEGRGGAPSDGVVTHSKLLTRREEFFRSLFSPALEFLHISGGLPEGEECH